jgi:hypothetical protein
MKNRNHIDIVYDVLKIFHDNLGNVSYGKIVELLRENIPELKDLRYSDIYPLLFIHNNELFDKWELEKECDKEKDDF